MAGKVCTSKPERSGGIQDVSLSRAFCQGRRAQIAGDLIGTNPYPTDGQFALESTEWDNGWSAAQAGNQKGCCAE